MNGPTDIRRMTALPKERRSLLKDFGNAKPSTWRLLCGQAGDIGVLSAENANSVVIKTQVSLAEKASPAENGHLPSRHCSVHRDAIPKCRPLGPHRL